MPSECSGHTGLNGKLDFLPHSKSSNPRNQYLDISNPVLSGLRSPDLFDELWVGVGDFLFQGVAQGR